MAKECIEEGCAYPVFGGGYCKFHQWKRTDKKPKKNKPKKRINPMSEKMEADYKIYRPIRDEYMSNHPICEVDGCNKLANDLHHKAGRVGYADELARTQGIKLLWDVRWFMAICRPDHTKCDTDPNWARENGYLV